MTSPHEQRLCVAATERVRCLKIDAAVTASALEQQIRTRQRCGIAKAARVLGLYCVAKGVQSSRSGALAGTAGIEFADRMLSRAEQALPPRGARGR